MVCVIFTFLPPRGSISDGGGKSNWIYVDVDMKHFQVQGGPDGCPFLC